MSSQQTYRLTLFKIPRVEDQDKLLDMYKAMPQKALKDGNPYIVSVRAGKTFPDQRAQGYTVAVTTTFASKEDFEYYDTTCAAHKELKAFAGSVHQGNLMAYFQSVVDRALT